MMEKATEKQWRFLKALCEELGFPVEEAVRRAVGKTPEELDRRSASMVIDWLLREKRARRFPPAKRSPEGGLVYPNRREFDEMVRYCTQFAVSDDGEGLWDIPERGHEICCWGDEREGARLLKQRTREGYRVYTVEEWWPDPEDPTKKRTKVTVWSAPDIVAEAMRPRPRERGTNNPRAALDF